MTQRITIAPDDDGRRLDATLARVLQLSRSRARELLASGGVVLNGRRAAAGTPVRTGDTLDIPPFTRPEHAAALPRPDLPLPVVARGDDWIIINKPAGMPVHPLRDDDTGTLLNAVAARFPEVNGVGEGGLRSGIVHRLDVDTSGALLIALTDPAWRRLRDVFTRRLITKKYLAIVQGRLSGDGAESMHLRVARHRPACVRVIKDAHCNQSGVRRCTLRWRTVDTARDATLIEVDLGTGFLHQIRVMMAHLGHPLLGDALYGGQTPTWAIRPMLHALHLTWPEGAGTAEPPEDFQTAWAAQAQPRAE